VAPEKFSYSTTGLDRASDFSPPHHKGFKMGSQNLARRCGRKKTLNWKWK